MNSYLATSATESPWVNTPGLTGHLLAISHFIQRKALDHLTASGRYSKLNLNYAGYIARLAESDHSPGELAVKLGITKQACSKTISELAALGLLARRRNPADSRSSILSLTPAGLTLLDDGMAATRKIYDRFVAVVGAPQLNRLTRSLERLCSSLPVALTRYPALESAATTLYQESAQLNFFVLKLSDYLYQSLIERLDQKGFSGLKPSYSQVLGLITPDGGRIQHLATIVGISKQAIAATAAELERLDYLVRETDPSDKRQVILRLSPRGESLLAEAGTGVEALEASLANILGKNDYLNFGETLAALYFDAVDHYDAKAALANRIHTAAQQILNDFGGAGSRLLAQQLLDLTKGEA